MAHAVGNPYGLHHKQWRFVQEYLQSFNGSDAYQRAGYKARGNVAESSASRLLKVDNVRCAIEGELKRLQQDHTISIDFVVSEYVDIVKVSSETKKAFVLKMHALDRLGMYCGMWGPLRKIDACATIEIDYELLIASFFRMLDPSANDLHRHACARILDYYTPEWREKVPMSILGYVVDRGDPLVSEWRAQVLRRDNFLCQDCGATDSLHAHHIIRWVDAPALRLMLENGVTVCQPCHVQRHTSINASPRVDDA